MPSTAIGRIAYARDNRELDVTFVGSGRTYTYIGVEPEVHEAFVRAPSKGQYFNARIRNRYPFRKWGTAAPESTPRTPRSPKRGPAPPTRH
jgi:hypothetical protein